MSPGSPSARRRREAVLAGYSSDETAARKLLADPDAHVRAAALAALARMGRLVASDLSNALADPEASVRRQAAELSTDSRAPEPADALADPDSSVVEAAAWALGERFEGSGENAEGAVTLLEAVARDHDDPLCREAAVAALGAIGHVAGLEVILHALSDRPAIRRRAVVALAAFDGPEVDAAIERAKLDRDWQVRQAAEDLASAAGST